MPSPPSPQPSHIDSSPADFQISPEVLAPWRAPLSRALQRNRSVPFSRYLQLATLRIDGTPANRTVVFRGFLTDTNQLMFISDRRSQKIPEITQNPSTEACWYFTKTREQFRLSGQLTLITSHSPAAPTEALTATTYQQVRQQAWQTLSDNARLQFAWPQPKAPRTDETAFRSESIDPHLPPNSFCLLLLSAQTIDHLELRGEPQNRSIYRKQAPNGPAAQSQWQVSVVNP